MNYTFFTIAPIILFPLFAFVIGAFIPKKLTKVIVSLSTLSIFISFLYSLNIFKDFVLKNYSSDYYVHKYFTWFDISHAENIFKIDMGFYIDNMTAVMLLMVSGVATLIHVFSTYYMAKDIRLGRFFVYLSLFTSAMLGLVLSDNLLSVFIFWEIMGFCSYSLIGFYYEKDGAGDASIKAFMTTRVGDVFFLLGILSIWFVVGNVTFVDIYKTVANGTWEGLVVMGIPVATLAAISIFMGTIGKSAQVPLHVWLPDAMWGPTPCSALIHAATMVAAGVYLSLRIYPLLEISGLLPFVAYVGSITAFIAATIALIQTDIKAVLAYSTISQLGYMVLGIGVGAYNAAFMHLITHAIFKACLFLSAGSVIHSLHDTETHDHVQEMPRMGGLFNKLRFTCFAMWCCTLAISGIPFFSGFVSKDRILGDALIKGIDQSVFLFPMILGFCAALLTAFYMCRMMFLTFHGSPRDRDVYDHCEKEVFSWNRNLPLLFLSVFTLGFWFSGSLTGQGIFKIVDNKYEWFKTLVVEPQKKSFIGSEKEHLSWFEDSRLKREWQSSSYDGNYDTPEKKRVHYLHQVGAWISIFIAIFGVFVAYLMYQRKSLNPRVWVQFFHNYYEVIKNKYFFDDLYISVLLKKVLLPLNNKLARFDMNFYDKYMVDGWEKVNSLFFRLSNWFDNLWVDKVLVDGTGLSIKVFNVILRTIQSGRIQFYFIIIIVVLIGYILRVTT